MQTFVPHWSMSQIAECLDSKRLNSQIKEAAQIETAILKHERGIKAGWQSHPATLMWYNYVESLRWYRHHMSLEFTRRFGTVHSNHCPPPADLTVEPPPWWFDNRVRDSHRAMLYRKDPVHYPEEWRDDSILDYFWPWRDEVTNYPRNQVMKFPSGKAGGPPLDSLRYPRFGSIKYDGSFCLVFDGELYSRNLILHPNRFLRDRFAPILERRDMVFMGEVFDPTRQFSDGQSITRSFASDMGETTLFVFDCMKMDAWLSEHGWLKFQTRYNVYRRAVEELQHEHIQPVYQEMLKSHDQATMFYERALAEGHEGIVTRDPSAYYKYGRCTPREADLFRHTEFERADGVVIEVRPRRERKDGVEVPRHLDGRAHRTFKQADHEASDVAGSIRVRLEDGRECGAGFGEGWTDERKRELWAQRDRVLGRTVEIEFKPSGVKDKPRQPKLVRFRDDKDVE